MSSILKVRHSTSGEWIDIPAIVGPKGEDGAPGKDAPQEAVLYTPQELTEEQKSQARENIGAVAVADLPTEGKWELIASGTMEEEARGIELTLDNDGNPFELTKAALHVTNIRRGTEMTANVSCHATLGSVFWAAGVVSAQAEKYTNHREFIAYANTNGSAWLAVRESANANRGPMIRPFSDFIGKTITKAEFMSASAHLKLAAGLTYELWGVRK